MASESIEIVEIHLHYKSEININKMYKQVAQIIETIQISPMELRPYFLGPNFFWRPDLGWKQSILGPTNYLPDVSHAL